MENIFASSRAEIFPAGLRVLVVDDDPTWIKILEKMLRKCLYEVTTCGLAREALDMLRERRDKFDIVISDVNMPDMDGFRLLEHVGLEMDLPVIMMSIDGETSRVMKGVQHGACDYLLKPVRMKELRNIWQHVYRKRMMHVKDTEYHDIFDDVNFFRSASEDFESWSLASGGDISSSRKRKDVESKEYADPEFTDPGTAKKARVVWSVDLHQKFVNAVNQIGFDKVGPKKILDLMNVPGITRENVASHLQKYRMYLTRIQRQNEGRTCSANIPCDSSIKDPSRNLNGQSSIATKISGIPVRHASSTFPSSSHRIISDVQVHETKRIVPLQFIDNNKALISNISGTQKVNIIPELNFEGFIQGSKHSLHDTSVSKHEPGNRIPLTQFMQYPMKNYEQHCLFDEYSCTPKPDKERYHVNNLSPVASSIISISCTNGEVDRQYEPRPVVADCNSGCISTASPQDYENKYSTEGPSSINNSYFGQSVIQACLPATHESSLKCDRDLDYFLEDLHLRSQGNGCFDNVGING